MLAVIRLRGDVDKRPDVRKTFELLGLKRKFTLAVMPDTPDLRGMIRRINEHVTWGELDDGLAKKLGEGKGEKVKTYRLHPPRGGFRRTIKRPLPDGECGYRGKEINALIERMIP